jgi:glycerate kinase
MKVVLAPDKFKGSLTSFEVCKALETAVVRLWPDADVYQLPMADGGDGFAAVLKYYKGTSSVSVSSVDALGKAITAGYEWSATEQLAIIEMAVASGLAMLDATQLKPLEASTYGTGLLLRDAIDRGAKEIILGLGGSATTDGGTGILKALGFKLLDANDRELPLGGGSLVTLKKIITPDTLPGIRIQIACDVNNALYGSQGAAFVYAPQKGADASQVQQLDNGLRQLAAVLEEATGRQLANVPGTGAAGGIAISLLSYFDVQLIPGIELISEAAGLENAMQHANLAITGEGKIDAQTLQGKVIAKIVSQAAAAGVPVLACCGVLDEEAWSGNTLGSLAGIVTLTDAETDSAYAMKHAAELLTTRTEAWFNAHLR